MCELHFIDGLKVQKLNITVSRIGYDATGCLKKTPEFSCIPRIVIIFKPSKGLTNYFFLLKTEIHKQIINTEPILYNFR